MEVGRSVKSKTRKADLEIGSILRRVNPFEFGTIAVKTMSNRRFVFEVLQNYRNMCRLIKKKLW